MAIDESLQAILDSISGNTEASVEGQTSATQIGVEGLLEQQARGQQFQTENADKAVGYYEPFITAGNYWGGQAKQQIDAGAPKFGWDKNFSYDTWKTPQTWDEYSKTRLTPEGAKDSPYYGLYQYQKQQQDLTTNQALRARGLWNSGAGMKEALNKQSGIDESFTANEYNRTLANYQQDYNQQLQEHNIGYEEAKQKYGMDYDQYLKSFGVEQGQWTDKLNTALGLREDQWRGSQGAANARINQGNQLGGQAIQTGQAIAGLQSSLSSGIGSTYNAQGNQLLSLYNTTANNATTMAGINAGQSNYNTANTTNAWLGAGTLASGVARTGLDAYRYYNPATTSTTTTGLANSAPDTTDYNVGYW